MTTCFLCTSVLGYPEYVKFDSISAAKDDFLSSARELDNYGQKFEASIHIADFLEEVAEYPDFVLSLGPKGGLKCQRA